MLEQQEFIIKLVSTVLRETSVQKLVGLESVCESLGISKDKVRELTASGELKGVKISERLTMWSVRDVNDFIERRKSAHDEIAGMRDEVGERKEKAGLAAAPLAEEAEHASLVPEEKAVAADAAPAVEEAVAADAAPEAEFVRCTAVHPKTGKQCVLALGHDGKHRMGE